MDIKVGMKIWVFDQMHRIYARDEYGKEYGSPIYREYFKPTTIKDETTRSWIIGPWNQKIPKKNFIESQRTFLLSEAAIDKAVWVRENRYKISSRIGVCEHYETLKEIDDILCSIGS